MKRKCMPKERPSSSSLRKSPVLDFFFVFFPLYFTQTSTSLWFGRPQAASNMFFFLFFEIAGIVLRR
ncbi:hypothetical protein BKA80DRAFT_51400 [Phyllosticta citrichinensis]